MRFKSTTGLAAIVTAAALALTGCGSSSGNGGGGSTNADGKVDGTGKTLNVLVGVLSQYPEQQKQWQSDIAAKFKAETGADVKFETHIYRDARIYQKPANLARVATTQEKA